MNSKTKRYIILAIVALALIIALAFFLPRGSHNIEPTADNDALSADEVDDPGYEENGIVFDEEEDGVEITKAEHPEEDFYGTWSATSDMSNYLYGNFDVTIEKGGKWHGNITEEDMSGTWTLEGADLRITNEWIDVIFSFTDNGTLVMQRDNSDEGDGSEFINTVMIKQ